MSGEPEKIVGTFARLNVGREDRDTPPRVFCKKSLDFAEKKGLEFLKRGKESVIYCGAMSYGLGRVRCDSF